MDEVKEVLFATAFPNRDADSYTILVYANTLKNHHILIWSPKAKRLVCEMTNIKDHMVREGMLNINGTVYTTDDDCLFKIIDLDYQNKISKSEIERLFKCRVID